MEKDPTKSKENIEDSESNVIEVRFRTLSLFRACLAKTSNGDGGAEILQFDKFKKLKKPQEDELA